MVTPAAKREAVAHLQTALGMSERRACMVVGADRTSRRYRSCREDNGDLRSRFRELAQQRRRFGYPTWLPRPSERQRLWVSFHDAPRMSAPMRCYPALVARIVTFTLTFAATASGVLNCPCPTPNMRRSMLIVPRICATFPFTLS